MAVIPIELIPQLVEKRITDAVEHAADQALELGKQVTPVDTGKMQRDWKKTKTPGGIRLGNSVPYAAFVDAERGIRDGMIHRIKSALAEKGA